MAFEGEKIKQLLSNARKSALLCAPFIKHPVLSTLLQTVGDNVRLKIVTRWHPFEVAAGVSDLEIFELCSNRLGTQLVLVDELHAKLFVADRHALVGSANLTGAALGWGQRPNIELLVKTSVDEEAVGEVLELIDRTGRKATATERDAVREQASALSMPESPASKAGKGSPFPWLPKCATPQRLFEIYRGDDLTGMSQDTIGDGQSDLRDLQLPQGLNQPAFKAAVKARLSDLQAFQAIMERIPDQLDDLAGQKMLQTFNSSFDERDAIIEWVIIRNWFGHFFDEFEVVANDHVIRIRS